MTTFTFPKWLCAVAGIIWCYIEPTIPFIAIAALAMLLDIYSAYRLNCRVRKRYGDKAKDGKLKSNDAAKIIPDAALVLGCILLGHLVDAYCFPNNSYYIPNYICAAYCAVQCLSILENSSTCNDAPWARIAQKFVANKIARHLDCSAEEVEEILRKEKED